MGQLPFERRTFEVLVKHEVKTVPVVRDSLSTLLHYGIIVVNKPKGPTSHMVSEYVQRILALKKAGHGGTLDPGVTGVLPVALGSATRIVQALLPAGKEYVCLMRLHDDRNDAEIRRVCASFVGVITQKPPVKSAVKRVQREREIYYLEILEIEDRFVLFRVGCQAGTYIRKLCEQIGKALGTNAHMQQLVRTKAGPFSDEQWVTLQDLEDGLALFKEGDDRLLAKCLHPIEAGVRHLPKVVLGDEAITPVMNGVDLFVPGVLRLDSDIAEGMLVAVMTASGRLLALGSAALSSAAVMQAQKGKAVTVEKVFRRPTDTYHV
ncbi:RNA-guided pseudouridylation complex pseudouridine synthase subunit Cbf5 [Candidatus Woesearchaeota archaeon]|nr:RNA-guided pseudouridylation complex pseudouridine synthase subunit Cbf5 [Candidatus Woesearchaeota archaeon]